MNITTKDIIKILPLEATLKASLLAEYDTLDPDRKLAIADTLWETYDTLFNLKLEENIKLALLQAKDTKETLGKDFYQRIREQTEKEMQQEQAVSVETVDLSAARSAMEKIIKEIQAAKAIKKA